MSQGHALYAPPTQLRQIAWTNADKQGQGTQARCPRTKTRKQSGAGNAREQRKQGVVAMLQLQSFLPMLSVITHTLRCFPRFNQIYVFFQSVVSICIFNMYVQSVCSVCVCSIYMLNSAFQYVCQSVLQHVFSFMAFNVYFECMWI